VTYATDTLRRQHAARLAQREYHENVIKQAREDIALQQQAIVLIDAEIVDLCDSIRALDGPAAPLLLEKNK
jgi:hypothetical protein